jgi:hypothetical protein
LPAVLKGGDIDALVELAKTLQEKTSDTEFVESMLVLIFELLPASAREQILADGAKAWKTSSISLRGSRGSEGLGIEGGVHGFWMLQATHFGCRVHHELWKLRG